MLQNIYKSITDYFNLKEEMNNPYIELTEVLKQRIALLEEGIKLREQTIVLQKTKLELLEKKFEQKIKLVDKPFPMLRKNKGSLIDLSNDGKEGFPYV